MLSSPKQLFIIIFTGTKVVGYKTKVIYYDIGNISFISNSNKVVTSGKPAVDFEQIQFPKFSLFPIISTLLLPFLSMIHSFITIYLVFYLPIPFLNGLH